MYSVKLDDSNYYTGSYAKDGKILGGVDVDTLPPSENKLCYKLKTVTEEVVQQEKVIQYFKIVYSNEVNESGETVLLTTEQEITKEEYEKIKENEVVSLKFKTDENGDYVFEDVTCTKTRYIWELDKNKVSEMNFEELNSLKKKKNAELNIICQNEIYKGIDVITSVGVEHFSLTIADQMNITTLYNSILQGEKNVLYHSDGNLCREFSAEEITKIMLSATKFVTYNTTLCNHLHYVVNNCISQDAIEGVTFSVNCLDNELLESFNAIVGV